MTKKSDIEIDLEDLRQALPDPFDLPSRLEVFFNSPVAQRLIAAGDKSVQHIMNFLESRQEPALVRVSMLLLSRFAPAAFYLRLLPILEKADRPTTEAFGAGLWLIQIPEQQIAQDLVRIVTSSGNPYPLLLLQRPVAKEVRSELASFIQQCRPPLSLYALYCYGYALEPDDIPLLTVVSRWFDAPEMSALAGLYLLKLGSKDGLLGVRAGLTAPDEQLRMMTYYELAKFLPKTVVDQSGYDPVKSGDVQQGPVDILINYLT